MKHFLFDIAGMTGDWKMEDVLEEEMEKIRVQVKSSTGWAVQAVQGGQYRKGEGTGVWSRMGSRWGGGVRMAVWRQAAPMCGC